MAGDWRLTLLDAAGDPAGDLVEASDISITWRLTAPGELTFTLNGLSERAALIDELITDVLAYRDGVLMFRGRVIGTSDTLDPARHTVGVTVRDYRWLLTRRTVWSTSSHIYTAQDQAGIAWDLISDSQGLSGGDWGITLETGSAVTGVNRTRTFEFGKVIEQAITEMAASFNGFDWDITPDRKFTTWYPLRGTASDFTLFYKPGGGNITGARTLDPSGYANAARFSGADTTTAFHDAVTDIATRPEGRFEVQTGQPDLDTDTEVDNAGQRLLTDSSTIRASYQLDINREAEWSPTELWLGDTVPLIIRSGRLDVDIDTERVIEVNVRPSRDGGETVSVNLGSQPPTHQLLRYLRKIGNRVENLERR